MAGADGAGGMDNINKKIPRAPTQGKGYTTERAYHETAFIIANMPLGVNDLQKGADFMAKQAKRNAQGAGTIRQRPDGRWEARYTLGRDPGTGKQVQKSIYGSTQAEVRKKLQAVSVDIDNGVYTEPSKMTVGQWLDIWKSEYLGGVKQTTRYSYTIH